MGERLYDLPPELSVLMPRDFPGAAVEPPLEVTLGHKDVLLGEMRQYSVDQTRYSKFTFSPDWLKSGTPHIRISPDLRPVASSQWFKGGEERSPFFLALADTIATGFAQRVMQRTLKSGLIEQSRAGSFGFCLSQVIDHCRLGALRVRTHGDPCRNPHTNHLMIQREHDLERFLAAVQAFERGEADPEQLTMLSYSATALGGSRPKCSLVLSDESLALVKFPSIFDDHSVVQAELLANALARSVGIQAVKVKLKMVSSTPCMLVWRYDRVKDKGRLPYLSAHSMMMAHKGIDLDLFELLQAMRGCCKDFKSDARQLWLRLVFNLLIGYTGTDLGKVGFLYAGNNRWRLAPASGLRPSSTVQQAAPRGREHGFYNLGDVDALLQAADRFDLSPAEAMEALSNMVKEVAGWASVARQTEVHMNKADIEHLRHAFDNPSLHRVRQMCGL